jgi:hypothetical protein
VGGARELGVDAFLPATADDKPYEVPEGVENRGPRIARLEDPGSPIQSATAGKHLRGDVTPAFGECVFRREAREPKERAEEAVVDLQLEEHNVLGLSPIARTNMSANPTAVAAPPARGRDPDLFVAADDVVDSQYMGGSNDRAPPGRASKLSLNANGASFRLHGRGGNLETGDPAIGQRALKGVERCGAAGTAEKQKTQSQAICVHGTPSRSPGA